MRLVSAESQRLIFRGRRAIRGAMLIGIAFIGVAIGPLIYGDPANSYRLITSTVAAIVAAIFIRAGWPKARQVVLEIVDSVLRLDGDAYPIAACRGLHLVSGLDEEDLPRYQVELELDGAGRRTLLEHEDPELVLRDLSVVVRSLDVPIVGGWGLPADAQPWRQSESSEASAPSEQAGPPVLDVSLPRVPAQREIGWTVIIGGVVVSTIALFQIGVRLTHGDRPTVLDVLLPVVLVTTIETIGIAVLTSAILFTMNGSLSVEWRMFGLARKRRVFRKDALRAVYAIGPTGLPPTHVLLETQNGPLAIPAAQRSARDLVAVIERHL